MRRVYIERNTKEEDKKKEDKKKKCRQTSDLSLSAHLHVDPSFVQQ